MSAPAPIQITRSGLVVSACPEDLERLRTDFHRRHCLRLPGFVEPNLLHYVQEQLEQAPFDEKVHRNVGVELCMTHNVTLSLLFFLTNDPRLFQLVRQLTGCERIGCFLGRVYRMVPGGGHYDSWHSDMVAHRMIAMSINLSAGIYEGGVFYLRESGSKEILSEVANTGSGDAIIFRIASHLEHQVTAVEGTTPKTAFAGWFKSEPEFLSLLGPDGVDPAGEPRL